jgi:hypothetical protein
MNMGFAEIGVAKAAAAVGNARTSTAANLDVNRAASGNDR